MNEERTFVECGIATFDDARAEREAEAVTIFKGQAMSEHERRLAAAQAEMKAAGLRARPLSPVAIRLMQLVGQEPRPWPYLPLHLRLLAYGLPFGLVWITVNAVFGWRGIVADPTIFLASTLLGIPIYTLSIGLIEQQRWCRKGLSRWEEL
ncbi:DUF6404 family protein [Rhodobacter maris]|uniref:Uncharacterized protein n=1 Tax=Rhodobacter maris TaxID=446682 RepID=A0A285S6I2_9RHOB|nr:DUF6404 family protein [Rhodobacter maris]SOC03037.1 hypothetical protein SAMN05877831_103280 [Rhodobacter maris]